jgi:hypothetical protein
VRHYPLITRHQFSGVRPGGTGRDGTLQKHEALFHAAKPIACLVVDSDELPTIRSGSCESTSHSVSTVEHPYIHNGVLPARNYSEGSRKILGSSAAVSAGAITAEIRHLTINNTGTSSFNSGVYTTGVTDESFSMLHVTATATGSSYNYGVYNSRSSPSMNNVTATATGGTSSYGVYNGSSSPSMNNVTATADDGSYSFGVVNVLSSPSMNNVTATATGGTNTNYGVYNRSSSSPSMNNVTATATGGTGSYGVRNVSSSSPSIRNSAITGTDWSILNSTSTAKVADTVLDGDVSDGGFTCVGVYTTAFTTLGVACV